MNTSITSAIGNAIGIPQQGGQHSVADFFSQSQLQRFVDEYRAGKQF